MDQSKIRRARRFGGCAALLALLAVSSYRAGGERIDVPAVPVMIETMPEESIAAATMEQTSARLDEQRTQALSLLESVLSDPQAGEVEKQQARKEKTQIAARMETEAAVQALLAHMGFEQSAVVMGENAMSIIVPWQAAENEHNRVRMIDAAVSQSGLSADAVKIILSKK